jgi:hypothetical protein
MTRVTLHTTPLTFAEALPPQPHFAGTRFEKSSTEEDTFDNNSKEKHQ